MLILVTTFLACRCFSNEEKDDPHATKSHSHTTSAQKHRSSRRVMATNTKTQDMHLEKGDEMPTRTVRSSQHTGSKHEEGFHQSTESAMAPVGSHMPWDRTEASRNDDDRFMQVFHEDDGTSMRPVSSEHVKRGANTTALHMTQLSRVSRDGKPSTIGVDTLSGIRCHPVKQRLIGQTAMVFNGSDAHATAIASATQCADTNSCPFQS